MTLSFLVSQIFLSSIDNYVVREFFFLFYWGELLFGSNSWSGHISYVNLQAISVQTKIGDD